MEYRILGPVEIQSDGERVSLGPKPRTVLAVLLLHANEVVSAARLADELWGEQQPATAAKLVQLYVSQLRKLVGSALQTRPPGYLLSVAAHELDAAQFERLLVQARAVAAESPEQALSLYEQALSVWRGRALADVECAAFARNEAERLDSARLAALEERFDVELALGHAGELVPELEALVAAEPLRERPRAQLMLALYRAGRRADALALYRQTRRLMVDELGLEPSEQLRTLERTMLADDSALGVASSGNGAVLSPNDAPAAEDPVAAPVRVRRRRRLLVSTTVAALAVATAATIVVAGGGRERSMTIRERSIALLDRTGRVMRTVDVGSDPIAMAAAAGAVWAITADGSLSRIPLSHDGVAVRFQPASELTAIAAGAGALWLVDADRRLLLRFDPDAGRTVQQIEVGNGADAVTAAGGFVWVANASDGTVTRVDAATGRNRRTFAAAGTPTAIAADVRHVWISDADNNTVTELDARSGVRLRDAHVGALPAAITLAAGSVWVANTLDGTISRINPATGTVRETLPIAGGLTTLGSGAGHLWAAGRNSATLTMIDPRAPRVIRRVSLSTPVAFVTSAGRRIAAAAGHVPARAGGETLTMVGREGWASTLDPATWWEVTGFQVLLMTNDGLVGYRRASGPDANVIVPDLAQSLPLVSNGGRTYTFTLRRGIRFSNGHRLISRDVRASFERLWRIRSILPDHPRSPATAAFPLGLVGEAACDRLPARCNLSRGIETDGATGTVVFHLTRPNPLFLPYLALPFYDVLPAGTPPRDGAPVPATGPYRITRWLSARHANAHGWRPGKLLELKRNPYFHEWSEMAQPDGYPNRIIWRISVNDQEALRAVLAGRADLLAAAASPAAPSLRALGLHHARNVFSRPIPWVTYAWLNTAAAPFDNVDARRAVAAAIDRTVVTTLLGGPLRARPACHLQPVGYPGSVPCHDTAPHPAAARALVERSGTDGAAVTVWAGREWPNEVALARYVVHVLRELGYRARLQTIADNDAYYAYVSDRHNRPQIGIADWVPDVPDGSAVLQPLLGCGSAANLARFCSHTLDTRMKDALTSEVTDRAAAAQGWLAADAVAQTSAPVIPLATARSDTVLSDRTRNLVWQPFFGLLLDEIDLSATTGGN